MVQVRGLKQKSWAQKLWKQCGLFPEPHQRAPQEGGLGENRAQAKAEWSVSWLSASQGTP
jgi:hypothetical protein